MKCHKGCERCSNKEPRYIGNDELCQRCDCYTDIDIVHVDPKELALATGAKSKKTSALTIPESNSLPLKIVWLVDYFPFGKAYF